MHMHFKNAIKAIELLGNLSKRKTPDYQLLLLNLSEL